MMMRRLQHKAGPKDNATLTIRSKHQLPEKTVFHVPQCTCPRLVWFFQSTLDGDDETRIKSDSRHTESLTCKNKNFSFSTLPCSENMLKECACVVFAVFSLFALLSGPTSPFYSLLSRGRSHLRMGHQKLNCHSENFLRFHQEARPKIQELVQSPHLPHPPGCWQEISDGRF